MRILFVTSNRVGDAVLSTGLLDHLIRRHPAARITVVCGRVAEELFSRMPNRQATIVLDKRPYGMHWPPLWASVVTTLWDLVVDIRGSALAWMVPTRRRAVWRRRPGPKIAELAAVLGVDPPPLPVVWTAAADQVRARMLLPGNAPVVALGPTANWSPKTWPADRFAALFRSLRAGPSSWPDRVRSSGRWRPLCSPRCPTRSTSPAGFACRKPPPAWRAPRSMSATIRG
jgi:ADP-heptose:LPS heptosyltransferase